MHMFVTKVSANKNMVAPAELKMEIKSRWVAKSPINISIKSHTSMMTSSGNSSPGKSFLCLSGKTHQWPTWCRISGRLAMELVGGMTWNTREMDIFALTGQEFLWMAPLFSEAVTSFAMLFFFLQPCQSILSQGLQL